MIMTRVFLADALLDERNALKVMLQDLKMDIVGEAADWPTTLALAPATQLDLLLVDWDLLPVDLGVQALTILRQACSSAIIVVLISHLDARLQAALSAGADTFISKNETPARIAERLRSAAARVIVNNLPLSAGATTTKPVIHLPRPAGSPGADKPNKK
jgi:DNA-binding NarL/FixJ family response regulator